MQPTNEQIERVAKWCVENEQKAIMWSKEHGSFCAGLQFVDSWTIVGILAESAKAAGIWFKTPAWFSGYQEWWSVASEPRPNGKSCIGKSNDPAFAAILAVDAYLVAKGAADAR